MVLQRRNQHLARQLEETLLKAPGQRNWPFTQRSDFVEQIITDERSTAERRGDIHNLVTDQVAAGREIGEHVAPAAQRSLVRGRRADLDGPRRMEPMPLRMIS